MSFAWPLILWLLFAPLILLVWEIAHRRHTTKGGRPKILRAEAGAHSLKLTASSESVSDGRGPRFWLCAGLMLGIFALARPQWGRLEEPVFDQSREILLAVDLSRSMLTPDVKPSRLERSKLLIQSLLERLKGERVGLVVFSGTSFLQSPLSADYEILREFLPALGPDFLPEGGTNYGAMLDAALQAFGNSGSADRFLIVLSDGEATDDEWKGKVEELKKKGIRVIGLGVGTAAGAMIPDGSGQFVKDDRGAVVLSKLEPATLQEIARATGGVYRDASGWVDLAGLVNETIEAGKKGQFVEKNTIRLVERYQWPLALALWCLFVSFCYEFPVRPKPRDIHLGAPPQPANRKPAAEKTTASAATTTATAAALLLAFLIVAHLPAPAFAAAKIAHPPASAPNTAPAAAGTPAMPGSSAASASPAAPPEEPSALGKIVGRLAGNEKNSARDWAELARETSTWGSKLQNEKQPVPEGPVRDALAAADLGAKLDPKAADWAKLRDELNALLEKPEEEKQDQQKDQKDQQQNKDDQQKQDQNKKDQKSDQQKQDKSGQQQQQDPQNKDDSQKQDDKQQQDGKQPEQKPQGDSAFGDMNKKDEPPPPPPPQPQSTQKVGGEKKDEPKEAVDPSLALPMQKLNQLRNQDSPAQLFQLMEGERKAQKKTGKDW